MWRVCSEKPLRLVLTAGYIVFAMVWLAVGFWPAGAAAEVVTGKLLIPAVGISEAVTESALTRGKFYVPEEIVGVYRNGGKKFLMGHSTTAFTNLPGVQLFDEIFYEGRRYTVVGREQKLVAEIKMNEIIRDRGVDELVLMTCAGEDDAERLIIWARR